MTFEQERVSGSAGARKEGATSAEAISAFGAASLCRSDALAILTLLSGATVSFGLHAFLLYVVLSFADTAPGQSAGQIEAITVEVLPSDVIEASHATVDAGGVAGAVAEQRGSSEDSPSASDRDKRAQPSHDTQPKPEPAQPRSEEIEHRDARAQEPDIAEKQAEITRPDVPSEAELPARADRSETTPRREPSSPPKVSHRHEREKDTARSELRKSKANASRQGGASARSVSATNRSRGRASASAGSLNDYRSIVRARIASNNPTGIGRGGKVFVAFGVSSGGGLAFARIMQSSGVAELDRKALAAVRSAAPFPPPPAGASPGQLHFSYYFQFN